MGRIVHFEIPAKDPEKALKFYSSVFNWTGQKWGDQDYWMLETGQKTENGINGAITLKKDFYQSVINTVSVENIDMSIEKIVMNGGQVITKKENIPNVGTFVYFKDPDGNILCAMQAEPGANM